MYVYIFCMYNKNNVKRTFQYEGTKGNEWDIFSLFIVSILTASTQVKRQEKLHLFMNMNYE